MRLERRQGWRGRGAVASVPAVLGLGGALLVAGAGAAPVQSVQLLANALHAGRARLKAPGAQAAIVVCGQVAWAGSDGVIDLQSKRPVHNNTPFVIASSTKTVTATMIMQRVQARRLSLDTRLARFYPDLPNAGRITVRMLLRNRSGLEEYGDIPALQDITDSKPKFPWTRKKILDEVAQSDHPEFPPGTEHLYTNTNWIVLGGILQKVTGKPIESYFQRNIAAQDKAGMSRSTWTRSRALVGVMAHDYSEQNGGKPSSDWINGFGPPSHTFGPVFTDGGLVSTATDLARFGNALLEGRLVSPATVRQMTQTPPSNDDYGLGIFLRKFDHRRWLGHDGSYGGYESENFTDPTRHTTITVTVNMDGEAVAEPIWKAVARAYDKQVPSAPTACPR